MTIMRPDAWIAARSRPHGSHMIWRGPVAYVRQHGPYPRMRIGKGKHRRWMHVGKYLALRYFGLDMESREAVRAIRTCDEELCVARDHFRFERGEKGSNEEKGSKTLPFEDQESFEDQEPSVRSSMQNGTLNASTLTKEQMQSNMDAMGIKPLGFSLLEDQEGDFEDQEGDQEGDQEPSINAGLPAPTTGLPAPTTGDQESHPDADASDLASTDDALQRMDTAIRSGLSMGLKVRSNANTNASIHANTNASSNYSKQRQKLSWKDVFDR